MRKELIPPLNKGEPSVRFQHAAFQLHVGRLLFAEGCLATRTAGATAVVLHRLIELTPFIRYWLACPSLCQARQSWHRTSMCAASTFDVFQRNKYLSLESFRKNGQGVRTPVWFAGDPPSARRKNSTSTARPILAKRNASVATRG